MKKLINQFITSLFIIFLVGLSLPAQARLNAELCCTDPPILYTCTGSGTSWQYSGLMECDGVDYTCAAWNNDGSGC